MNETNGHDAAETIGPDAGAIAASLGEAMVAIPARAFIHSLRAVNLCREYGLLSASALAAMGDVQIQDGDPQVVPLAVADLLILCCDYARTHFGDLASEIDNARGNALHNYLKAVKEAKANHFRDGTKMIDPAAQTTERVFRRCVEIDCRGEG